MIEQTWKVTYHEERYLVVFVQAFDEEEAIDRADIAVDAHPEARPEFYVGGNLDWLVQDKWVEADIAGKGT